MLVFFTYTCSAHFSFKYIYNTTHLIKTHMFLYYMNMIRAHGSCPFFTLISMYIVFMVTLKLMSKQDWHLWMWRRSLYTLFLHIVRTNARKGFWLIRSNKITILSLSVMSCRRTWAVIKPFHFKNIPFPVFDWNLWKINSEN